MEYGKLLSRSVNIVWQNKFLILLGILASLANGSFNGGGGNSSADSTSFGELGQLSEFQNEIAGLAAGLIIGLICVLVLVGLVLWAISTIARGGMIASADSIESGEKSSFSQAWGAGWHKAWTLLGIGFLPAIPGLILFVLGIMAFGAYGGIYALFGEELSTALGTAEIGIMIAALLCIVGPIVLVLSILRNFAERACMLEDLGIIESYRRGTSVLMSNLGEAIILFLLQIAIFFILGILLFVPGIISAICCCLWPLLLVVQGAISAFLTTLWTLAWRTWTGGPPIVEKAPVAA